jgi:o-succinylbenzoate---CoA ligase
MDELSISAAALDPSIAPRPALVVDGVAWSFAEVASRVARARARLSREGVAPGSRVAVVARNAPETAIAILALIEIGATLVPVHPRLTEAEASVLLADAAPSLVLREADLARASEGDLDAPPPAPVRATLPLAMVYTSGTTGRPKGAVLSRRAFLASARGSAENLGWIDEDRWICAMPLCHVGGLSILTRCLIARRAAILLPRFDPDGVLAAIDRDRATLLSVVPTMLSALLDLDADDRLSRLRAVLVGGAAASPALLDECARRGIRALTTYGLTEACSQVTVQRLADPRVARRGSGEPLEGVEIRVVREDGSLAIQGEIGRLHVRGPTLMDGYWEGAGRALDPHVDVEGWLDTGDLGELGDQGTLHVHARRTDLVVTGGENVYPVEIEQVLEAVAGVRRALVFGVADDRWGQLVAAAIEADAGVDPAAILRAAAARLAPHKRPRLACVVDALPLTSSGKVERSRAADRYAGSLRPLA